MAKLRKELGPCKNFTNLLLHSYVKKFFFPLYLFIYYLLFYTAFKKVAEYIHAKILHDSQTN